MHWMDDLSERKQRRVRGGGLSAYALRLIADVRARLKEPSSRTGARLMLGVAGFMLFVLGLYSLLILQTPLVAALQDVRPSEASIAYTVDGRELTRYHIENRTWVPIEHVSPYVVDALIATEDHRFYRHSGVDVPRILGAVIGTAGGERQGGSTITMQLARNLFPSLHDRGAVIRKVKEWLIALRLEDSFSKDDVLEMYLNTVPFLYDAVGIEAAARTYFQKSSSNLDLPEAATLIAMLKATSTYNPVRSPERSHSRRNVVLANMVRHARLDPALFERLSEVPTPLNFLRLTRDENRAPYFAEYVRQWLNTWATGNGYNLYRDGLRIYTTIDSRLQEVAEEAVANVADDLQAVVDVEWSSARPPSARDPETYRRYRADVTPWAYFWERHPDVLTDLVRSTGRYRSLAHGVSRDSALARLLVDMPFLDSLKASHQRLEAGLIAIEPGTGHIRAWVGGRNFSEDEYDHVALARRQPGSTFKPFVYVAALQNGYSPYSMVWDEVREYVDPYTGARWRPGNFGEVSGGLLTLREALAHSKNTVTAQLITTIGPDKVVDYAHRMGIRSDLQAVPSLGLGTSEVTLMEMTGAYTTFANQGQYREPVLISRIEDRDGNVLATFSPEPQEAIPSYTAYAVLDMMRGAVDYGTAVRMRFMFGGRGDLAGKTGTTQRGADGWFMLLHPDLVVGSWTGFNSPSVPFRSSYWGQGAHNALHITGTFYQSARKLGQDYFDPNARFVGTADHAWGSGYLTESDALNRRERQESRLNDFLRRLKRNR